MANTMPDRPTVIRAQGWTSLPAEFRRPGVSEHSKINQKRGKLWTHSSNGPSVAELDICSLLTLLTAVSSRSILTRNGPSFLNITVNQTDYFEITSQKYCSRGLQVRHIRAGPVFFKELHNLAAGYHGGRLKRLNDLVISGGGVIYFTNQGIAGLQDMMRRVFRLCSDRLLELLVSNGPSPNGLVLGRDDTALFVAMTMDISVWYVPFLPDVPVQRIDRFSNFYGIGGPDGMAQDTEGNVLVAHPTPERVFVHSSNGELMM